MSGKNEEELAIIGEEKVESSIDEIVQLIGEFQRYQWFVGSLLCLALIPVASQYLIMYFGALNPSWRCVHNSTHCLFNGTLPPENTSRCNIPRTEWRYTEEKHYSIVTEFDLHCGSSWIIEFSTSVMFLGALCGSVGMGWIADTYGRRKTIFFSTALVILLGVISSFIRNVHIMILLRFLIGAILSGGYQSSVLLSEIVTSHYRPLASNLIWFFFPICLCIVGVKAYFIRSWNILMLICSAPYVFVLSFYYFVPESPRWLRIKGRKLELRNMLKRVAKVNKKPFPENVIISYPKKENKRTNPLHLIRTCKMANITIISGFAGFTNALTYNGLSLLASDIGGSLYTNFILFSLSEIPATVCSIYFSFRAGRKYSTVFSILCVGISCIISIFLPEDQATVRVVLGIMGKFFVTTSWNCLGVWVIELYPTSLRSQGISFGSLLSTIGSAIAPWISTGLRRYYRSGPFICMSGIALMCALLLCLLPDTTHLPTMESETELTKEEVVNKRNSKHKPEG